MCLVLSVPDRVTSPDCPFSTRKKKQNRQDEDLTTKNGQKRQNHFHAQNELKYLQHKVQVTNTSGDLRVQVEHPIKEAEEAVTETFKIYKHLIFLASKTSYLI